MFACVNKQTYAYCKNTNNEHNKYKHQIKYNYTLSLFQNAKLSYCMNLLSSVNTLYINNIPLQRYNIQIILGKPCGSTTKIIVGRELIINTSVYTFNTITALCDLNTKTLNNDIKIFNMKDYRSKLEHKLNSIITHKYSHKNIRVLDRTYGDYHKFLVGMFYKDIHKFLIKML